MKLNKPEYMPGQVLEDGSIYVGFIGDYHLSIEPSNAPDLMTWDDAMKLKGLPTITEMNLISANARSLGLSKCEDYYWSSSETINGLAWIQRFSDGSQSLNTKNNTYRERCVRRHPIVQSFGYLLPELESMKLRIDQLIKQIK